MKFCSVCAVWKKWTSLISTCGSNHWHWREDCSVTSLRDFSCWPTEDFSEWRGLHCRNSTIRLLLFSPLSDYWKQPNHHLLLFLSQHLTAEIYQKEQKWVNSEKQHTAHALQWGFITTCPATALGSLWLVLTWRTDIPTFVNLNSKHVCMLLAQGCPGWTESIQDVFTEMYVTKKSLCKCPKNIFVWEMTPISKQINISRKYFFSAFDSSNIFMWNKRYTE